MKIIQSEYNKKIVKAQIQYTFKDLKLSQIVHLYNSLDIDIIRITIF